MKATTTDEIYKANGFTDEMMLPSHLVKMLMHKYAEAKVNELNKSDVIKSVCPKCQSESVTKASGNNWCDDCGNVWRQTV